MYLKIYIYRIIKQNLNEGYLRTEYTNKLLSNTRQEFGKKNYNLLKKRVNTWGVLLWMVKWGLGLVLSKYNEVTINISFRR